LWDDKVDKDDYKALYMLAAKICKFPLHWNQNEDLPDDAARHMVKWIKSVADIMKEYYDNDDDGNSNSDSFDKEKGNDVKDNVWTEWLCSISEAVTVEYVKEQYKNITNEKMIDRTCLFVFTKIQ
jgi:hypothetical protein